MEREGVTPQLPDCSAQYMLGFLFEVGPSLGGTTLSHAEIESWQRNTGISLTFWEARTLHRLSRDYMCQAHESTARNCPAPYAETITEDQSREIVANKFMAMMSQSKVTRD